MRSPDSFEIKTLGPRTTFDTVRERAIIVGVDLPSSEWTLESSLAELERLAHTAGADAVATITQKLSSPNPATFIGSGKAKEISELAIALDADVVIFDDELSPSQQSNLEKAFPKSVKVIDRTALILDIFGMRANSREGRLQVRLAQNQYLYPRLRGMWAHLASNRMGGGVGSRFGEGESQLEVDRRMIRNRITNIKRELSKLQTIRDLQRSNRYDSSIFKIAIAGYTNAGKSSFLNKICNAEVLSDDLLFATLDSTTRKYVMPNGRNVTFTDTVGFIQKLPTTLIEAFKSTLDEINGSDLILHVIDASSTEFESQMDAVLEILEDIEAQRIPRVTVFNKIDLLDDLQLHALRSRFKDASFISVETGEGINDLIEVISRAISSQESLIDLLVPYEKGNLVSMLHEQATIIHEEYAYDGIKMYIKAPRRIEALVKDYIVS